MSERQKGQPGGLSRDRHRFYWRGQVYPRRMRLTVRDWSFWLAILTGPLLVILIGHLPGRRLSIHQLAGAGLSYASIAFGACVTGVVLL